MLSGFRYLERVIPTLHFGKLQVKTRSTEILEKQQLYELIEQCHIYAYEPSYSLEDDGRMFVYEMTIRSYKQAHFQELTERLRELETVREFSVIPTGD